MAAMGAAAMGAAAMGAVAFQARHRDGGAFLSELFINRLDSHNVVVLVRRLEASRLNGDARIVMPVR